MSFLPAVRPRILPTTSCTNPKQKVRPDHLQTLWNTPRTAATLWHGFQDKSYGWKWRYGLPRVAVLLRFPAVRFCCCYFSLLLYLSSSTRWRYAILLAAQSSRVQTSNPYSFSPTGTRLFQLSPLHSTRENEWSSNLVSWLCLLPFVHLL